MQRQLAKMGIWKRDMVGCGRVWKRGGGMKDSLARASANRIHEHLSTTAAGNEIGGPGAKDLSVALAKCPNLHALNLSGQ